VKNCSTEERPLPHNLDAERAIIGAILLAGPRTERVEEALRCVQCTDFFLPQHRVIFRHMKRLHQQNKPTNDIVLLYESLEATQELEAAGGVAYVSSVPDGLPRVANLSHYVEIVKMKALLRQKAHIAETILAKLRNANGNAAEVLRDISALSAPLREEIGQKRILNFKSGSEFAAFTEDRIEWIIPGYVAKGATTELGAKVKMGKTTLNLNMVRAAAEGQNFLGKPTLKSSTVYLTEQPPVSFRQAIERAGLLSRDDFRFLLHSDARTIPWPELAAAAVGECKRVGATLLVVDTLGQFAGLLGDSENNSGDALAAMQPLQRAASEGIAVVIVRHERKSGGDVGDSGRGSSAFAGAVDIVLSLRKPVGNSRKTLRVLQAVSRFSETPAELLIELRENTYVALGEPHDAAVREAKDSIIAVAPNSESEAVDLKSLIESCEVPRATAQRAIDELLREDELRRIGEGKTGKPFRYFRTGIRSAQPHL
jgi:hypothetical protein